VIAAHQRLLVLLRQAGEPSGINRIYRLHRVKALFAGASDTTRSPSFQDEGDADDASQSVRGVCTQYFTPPAMLTGCSPIFVSFDICPRIGADHCFAIQSYVDWVFTVYVQPLGRKR
jgi:hypothetical protein